MLFIIWEAVQLTDLPFEFRLPLLSTAEGLEYTLKAAVINLPA